MGSSLLLVVVPSPLIVGLVCRTAPISHLHTRDEVSLTSCREVVLYFSFFVAMVFLINSRIWFAFLTAIDVCLWNFNSLSIVTPTSFQIPFVPIPALHSIWDKWVIMANMRNLALLYVKWQPLFL